MKGYHFVVLVTCVVACATVKQTPQEEYDKNRRWIDAELRGIDTQTRLLIQTNEVDCGWIKEEDVFGSRSHFPQDIESLWYLDGEAYYRKKIQWLRLHNFTYSPKLIAIYQAILKEIAMGKTYGIHRMIYK